MTIQPIGDNALLGGAAQPSYDAARMSAESKSFQATLDELQRKAAAAPETEETGYVPKNPMSAEEREAKKLREACEGFEAMFLSMMYTEMMNAAAKSGGIGIADMMYKQLTIKTR